MTLCHSRYQYQTSRNCSPSVVSYMKEILTMCVMVRTRNVLGGWLRDESLTRTIIPQILTPLYYITAQTRSTYSHDRQLVIFSFDSGVRSEYRGSMPPIPVFPVRGVSWAWTRSVLVGFWKKCCLQPCHVLHVIDSSLGRREGV
jgi:hypothetical protein